MKPQFNLLPATFLSLLATATVSQAAIIAGYDFRTNQNDIVGTANMTATAFVNGGGLADNRVASIGDNSGKDADGVTFGSSLVGTMGISVSVALGGGADTAGFNAAVAANDYFKFTVTPDAGYKLNLTSISFKASTSNINSVDQYAVTNSAGTMIGSIATITTVGQTTAYQGVSVDLSAAAFQNITAATEFRIYAWGRGSGNTTGTLAMLDNVVLNGAVVEIPAIPEPSSSAMLLGSLGLLMLRRRRTA